MHVRRTHSRQFMCVAWISIYFNLCVYYLSIHTGHRAPSHAIGNISVLVNVVVQQIFKASITELKQLVRIRGPTLMWRNADFGQGRHCTGSKEALVSTRTTGDWKQKGKLLCLQVAAIILNKKIGIRCWSFGGERSTAFRLTHSICYLISAQI